MPVQTIITAIAAIQATIAGVKIAYDNPPHNLNAFPCFVNFMGPAEVNYTPSRRETKHTIKMQLYVSKQILPEAEKILRPFIDLTLDKFGQNLQLNASCAYSMVRNYEPGVLSYGNTSYIGISFDLLAVEHESISFNV